MYDLDIKNKISDFGFDFKTLDSLQFISLHSIKVDNVVLYYVFLDWVNDLIQHILGFPLLIICYIYIIYIWPDTKLKRRNTAISLFIKILVTGRSLNKFNFAQTKFSCSNAVNICYKQRYICFFSK